MSGYWSRCCPLEFDFLVCGRLVLRGKERSTEDGMLLYLPLLGRGFATFSFDILPRVCQQGLKSCENSRAVVWEQNQENERVNGFSVYIVVHT